MPEDSPEQAVTSRTRLARAGRAANTWRTRMLVRAGRSADTCRARGLARAGRRADTCRARGLARAGRGQPHSACPGARPSRPRPAALGLPGHGHDQVARHALWHLEDVGLLPPRVLLPGGDSRGPHIPGPRGTPGSTTLTVAPGHGTGKRCLRCRGYDQSPSGGRGSCQVFVITGHKRAGGVSRVESYPCNYCPRMDVNLIPAKSGIRQEIVGDVGKARRAGENSDWADLRARAL